MLVSSPFRVDTFRGSQALEVKSAFLCQIPGAKALPRYRSLQVTICGWIKGIDIVGGLSEILSLTYLEASPIDDPAGDESSFGTMGADRTGGAAQLMVHQECKVPVAAGVSAEAVGNAHHPVTANSIADG